MRGPLLDTGVGSVTSIFICTTPPGGAVSFGMCNEICRVGVEHDPDPPLVDPDVLVVVGPPLVDPDPDVLCAKALSAQEQASANIMQADDIRMVTISS